MKKFLSIILVALLTLSLSANAFAAETPEVSYGSSEIGTDISGEAVPSRLGPVTLVYKSYTTPPSSKTYISITPPYRYLDIAARSTAANGDTSINVGVELLESDLTSTQNFFTISTNNTLSGIEAITVSTSEQYYITIINSSSTTSVTTHVECYSWG